MGEGKCDVHRRRGGPGLLQDDSAGPSASARRDNRHAIFVWIRGGKRGRVGKKFFEIGIGFASGLERDKIESGVGPRH